MNNKKIAKSTDVAAPAIRAAQYVRMSTEHQQYSTENQRDAIAAYAAARNIEIVRTYADDGKSGLQLDGRESMQRLFADVESGNIDFSLILVYDISRWGRFQDADESAHYEFVCKQKGVRIEYCAEQFENDGRPVSVIIKGVKRMMAAEYSRELSDKVYDGQKRLIELGYRQGGTAGYGLRRMLIDMRGTRKGLLAIGEQKSIQTDRVILVPGPAEEVKNVRWMYCAFVQDGKNENEIADALNSRGVLNHFGSPWSRGTVREVLINEKYIGNNVFNRRSFKLKMERVNNPPEKWVRAEGAFEPIIDQQLFYTARGIILSRSRRFSKEEMLEQLRGLYEKQGRLSGLLIDETEGMPSSLAYKSRFGGLLRAYQAIGYTPETDYEYVEINRRLRAMHPDLVESTIRRIEEIGGGIELDQDTGLLRVNGEFTVSLVLARCRKTSAGSRRWHIRMEQGLRPDITVAVRMGDENHGALDYYLLPMLDMTFEQLRLADENGFSLDIYRFDNLDYLVGLAEQVKVEVAS